MKFFIAFALVAAVAAAPLKFQPDQIIFVSDVPSDIFARIDFGPAIVEHSHVLIVDDVNSQLLNAQPIQMFDDNLPKPSPVIVVDIAEIAEPMEAAEAAEVSEPIEVIEAVQVVDFAQAAEAAAAEVVDVAETVEAIQDVKPMNAPQAVQVVDFAEAFEADKVAEDAVAVSPVQVVDVAEYIEADAAAEIAENIPEIVESIVLAEPSLPEVASDILY